MTLEELYDAFSEKTILAIVMKNGEVIRSRTGVGPPCNRIFVSEWGIENIFSIEDKYGECLGCNSVNLFDVERVIVLE